jgi:hypothetical protein
MGGNNAFTKAPTAAAGGAAPSNPADQTGGLLRGGWNDLAQSLTLAYGMSRISTAAPVPATDTAVTSPAMTPSQSVSARPVGAMGLLSSPMGLMLIGGAGLVLFLALRK